MWIRDDSNASSQVCYRWLSDEHLKKKNKPKGAKMVELQYFEISCKENCILRKTTVKFIFWEKIYFETLYAQKYS